jgi:hypothetical protein
LGAFLLQNTYMYNNSISGKCDPFLKISRINYDNTYVVLLDWKITIFFDILKAPIGVSLPIPRAEPKPPMETIRDSHPAAVLRRQRPALPHRGLQSRVFLRPFYPNPIGSSTIDFRVTIGIRTETTILSVRASRRSTSFLAVKSKSCRFVFGPSGFR